MRRLAFAFLFVLAGCGTTGLTPEAALEANMAASCKAFTAALATANTFDARMTAEQIQQVGQAVNVIQPACHAFRNGEMATEATLQSVRDELRRIVLINEGMKP